MNIREIHENKTQFRPLLLLADEENMIERYLERGSIYAAGECASLKNIIRREDHGL